MSSEADVEDRTGSAGADDSLPVSVSVRNLTKTYLIYRRPHHRLLQWISDKRDRDRDYAMRVEAVHDVTFDVYRGETVVILGRNGSGKSTTLQMVAGTLHPTSGDVEVDGRVSALLELGAGFNPDYTGRENLRLNASIFGLTPDEIEDAEPQIEAFADIGPFIDEPVRTYSSGMYVRLAFATAIHLVPDVLIVDEALAVGDVFFQQKCMDYIVNRMSDATKLIVTHDVSTASRLADRVLVMERGRLVFDGPPLDGVEYYTSLNLRGRAIVPTAEAPVDAEEEEDSALDTSGTEVDEQAVVRLPADRSSNPESMRFDSVAIGVDHGPGIRWRKNPAINPGDRVMIRARFELLSPIQSPIFGYLVRDRVGNVVFGQNTIGSNVDAPKLRPGNYEAVLELTWPEVAEGEYTITVGAGEGEHPLHHFIVCWGQNLTSVVSSPRRAVHGMFNVDIEGLRLVDLSPDRPGTQV